MEDVLLAAVDLPMSLYGTPIRELVNESACQNYGTGQRDQAALERLQRFELEDFCQGTELVDREMAGCCLAGLWLLHNELDRSHELSQRIGTAEGSYWHGIMHRLEGDYSNSKYWHRSVGDHQTDRLLQSFVAKQYSSHRDKALHSLATQWDAATFIDFARLHDRPGKPLHTEYHQIAISQWRYLFDFCLAKATGTDE